MAGDAFRFEGAGKVRITEAASLDLSRTNRWTITAWVRLPTSGTSASPTIFSEGHRVVALTHQPGTDKVVSWINGANPLESTVSLPAGTWCHVALVLDRTTRTLYVNGGPPVGTATGTPATTPDSTGSAIGGVTTDEAAAAFVGDIDELTLHRRVLSEEEIEAMFRAGSDGLCFGDGAPAWVIEPQSQTAPLFGDATFTGLAMGSPRPTYQWFFNDTPLAGQTGFTLALTGVTTANDGIYKLVATSGAQSTSAEVKLTVQHCVTTPPGLVAWWPADGSALDFTGNHSGGLWFGAGFADGVAGQAFQFDGASAYVAVADAAELSPHPGADGEMSVDAWVRLRAMPLPNPLTGAGFSRVLTKGDPGRWEYTLRITMAGVPEFIVTSAAGEWYGSVAGGQLLIDRWHHLVGVLKKGAYLRLYQDGNLMEESTSFTGDTSDTGSPLYIGGGGSGYSLNGRVDEPAIYNRALNGEEVRALYEGGSVGKCYDGGPAPVFVQEPRDKEGYLLNSVTLEGLALGTPRPTYQWYHEGAAVVGATNAALTLSDLSPAEGGPYYLVASNRFGVAQSRNLTLTLVDWATVKHGFELEGDWKEWREWSTDDHSIWQIGYVGSGPGAAHSGMSCAGTVMGGDYPDNRTARLVSSLFTVPAATDHPRLRFWHWWSFNSHDFGQVEITTNNGASWQPLSHTYESDSSGRWTRASLDLKAYAGQTVRLGFFFRSVNVVGAPDVAPGWYIDDVEVKQGPPPQMQWPDSFEDAEASDRWTADFGVWEIGAPTSGPGSAHSGSRCLATILSGDYTDGRGSLAHSHPVLVPPANGEPRLRFWHWWSFNSHDFGQVLITTNNWASWQPLSPTYEADSGGRWTRATLDLKAYAGQTVRLGFYFRSVNVVGAPDVAPGWYIDDLMIQVGNIGLAEVPSQTVNERTPVSFRASAVGANANSSLVFTLPSAPAGAWIDPESGSFSWVPGERQGPGVYRIPVYVVDYGNHEANEMTVATITVNEVNEPPWLLPASLAVEPGQTLRFPLFAGDRDFPKNPLKFSMTGAPAGLTLTTNTGILQWDVPLNAPAATHRLNVTLSDNGSPNYTTNNTITVTVTPDVVFGPSVRHLGGADFEFTIHDAVVGQDYILQHATAIVDSATWLANGDRVPAWVATLPEEAYLEWLSWEDFVQARLQRTAWVDVVRVAPAELPHSFVLTVTEVLQEPIGLFRLVRVPR
ncbi:MAG: hypothetical protein HS113_03920 [Verrucomicrobiales bacterium]|nr:hypothetical protein [Verrucomicrobiales bacterium]